MAPNPCPQCASGSTERSESAGPSLRWAAYGLAFIVAWWMFSGVTYSPGAGLVLGALFLWPVARGWRRSSAAEHRPAGSYSFSCSACGHKWERQSSGVAKALSVTATALLMLWSGVVTVVRGTRRAVGRTLKVAGAVTVVSALAEEDDSDAGGRRPDPDHAPPGPSPEELAAWAYVAQREREKKEKEDAEKEAERRSRGPRSLDSPRPGAATNLGEYKPGRSGNLG